MRDANGQHFYWPYWSYHKCTYIIINEENLDTSRIPLSSGLFAKTYPWSFGWSFRTDLLKSDLGASLGSPTLATPRKRLFSGQPSCMLSDSLDLRSCLLKILIFFSVISATINGLNFLFRFCSSQAKKLCYSFYSDHGFWNVFFVCCYGFYFSKHQH